MERSEEKRYAIEICDLVKFYGKRQAQTAFRCGLRRETSLGF